MKYMLIMRASDEAMAAGKDLDFNEILDSMGRYNDELIKAGVLVAAEAWVAIMRAAGVELRVGDPFGDASSAMAQPTGACATSIVMCMVLGTALAVGLNWKARRPAHTYVVVACTLTFVSLGAPLVAAGTNVGSKFTLIVAHLIAAAVIIPLVARCLADRR